jgi:hypothetical protein
VCRVGLETSTLCNVLDVWSVSDHVVVVAPSAIYLRLMKDRIKFIVHTNKCTTYIYVCTILYISLSPATCFCASASSSGSVSTVEG